ncbi:MAG: dATP pyrophosphohydrolase [Brevundimonas sp.]|jgi:hypothetical protein|uniref:dATP pyrophosphohydrolase n=2 Tax=unclassified Brevundimonas TaxID=2622653 RepID=UPI00198F2A2E|nr:dATP pyrophosphohydrolase [Brevundimonas sp.]MBD3836150.1 dATP pyrophosphohydrolase [Brevundimonas sp.]MCV0416540.1 dATP pyrophosphohydrolase [Brevundimonas sp.]
MMPLQIVPVVTPAELDRFIALSDRINAGDPNYVPPLRMERREALSPKKNPFFAHADVQLWLAIRDGRDVGRISAQIDHMAPPSPDGPHGHFGLICAEDDAAVFAALFETAESWLKARGCRRALGPFNLSINEEVGLLIDGFDTPPMVMMGHDPAYAGSRIEALGYAKAKDVFAYTSSFEHDLPEPVTRRVKRGPPPGLVLRPLDMHRYDAEVDALTDILNDAWSDNWGFTPVTEAETRQLAIALKPVIDPRLTWFAEIDGDVAGFVVFLPNVNAAIADLKGRLLPFGWARLLWRLKVRRVKSIRVPLMGVKRRHARTQKGIMAPFHLVHIARSQARALGYRHCEMSWILEDNTAMRGILDALGARIYKTYRIYHKPLA